MNIVMTDEDGNEYSGSGYVTNIVTNFPTVDVTMMGDDFSSKVQTGMASRKVEMVLDDLLYSTNKPSLVEPEVDMPPAERLLRRINQ